MNQPLSRRMLFGAALGSTVVGVLFVVGFRLLTPVLLAAGAEHRLSGIDLEACAVAPSSWGWRSGELSFYAYDRDGHAANPAAPPLEERLLRRVLAESEVAVERSGSLDVSVFLRASDGPCAVLRVTSPNPEPALLPWFRIVLGGAVLLGALISVVGTMGFVVRPLRKRIETLAVAARTVGNAGFEPPSPTGDALGHIAGVLGHSHRRIVEAQSALEARNRALEQHLAGVAHDLRTPLASMHLALEALATPTRGPAREEARRALADAVYLSSMVENLHQATRLRHELDATAGNTELSDLVRRVEARFSIVGRHAGVEVAASTPEQEVRVACLPALAERAVANLVQNAVEHNAGPGHVAITLSLVDGGAAFELKVVDDGPGVPPQTLASLQAEAFLLDEARSRGPGMGTLIVQEIARRVGWTVEYRTGDPNGLEVRLRGKVRSPPV